jgi:hypothetical protein
VQSVHLTTHSVPFDDTPQGQLLSFGLTAFDMSESVDSDDDSADIGVSMINVMFGSLPLLGREVSGDGTLGEFPLLLSSLLKFSSIGLKGGVFGEVGDPLATGGFRCPGLLFVPEFVGDPVGVVVPDPALRGDERFVSLAAFMLNETGVWGYAVVAWVHCHVEPASAPGGGEIKCGSQRELVNLD